MKFNSVTPTISVLLAAMLAVSPIQAQNPAPLNSSPGEASAQTMQLQVIDRDGENASVNSSTSKGFVVQVVDASGAGVHDAAVALRLPDSGPTGTFTDGSHSIVSYTDAAGRATISGIHWGDTAGPIAIRVTATKGTSHAGILIEQNLRANGAPPTTALAPPAQPGVRETPAASQPSALSSTPVHPLSTPAAVSKPEPSVSVTSASPGQSVHSGGKAKWFILVGVAAAAGIGVAMAGKGKSSSPSATPSSLSIGSPSISIGHP